MRVLLAVALILTAPLAFGTPADAGGSRKAKSTYSKRAYDRRYAHLPASERPPRNAEEAATCVRARYADPTGLYRYYPCWAREALSPSSGNDIW
ncbi:MAG TPA: hypothetical protein VFY92_13215 [Hyphomicrobiaceae bacterium]|nr:hypothetical protein [Hyphomicrobiaceae bacterium]